MVKSIKNMKEIDILQGEKHTSWVNISEASILKYIRYFRQNILICVCHFVVIIKYDVQMKYKLSEFLSFFNGFRESFPIHLQISGYAE
jgi:hypothetical protein